MRKHLSIGASFALAAALCVAGVARADTVTFNDIDFSPYSYGSYSNHLYDGGLHFMEDQLIVMPVGLNATPVGQASQFMEAGNYFDVEPITITHYTGTAPQNAVPFGSPDGTTPTPAGPDYVDNQAFNLWYLKIGLGDGNTGGTDMVTISGLSGGDCTALCNPTMSFAVTNHFQLITLDGFTDLTKVTISQQTIGESNAIDVGWLGFDDFSYTAFVPGTDVDTNNPRPDPPSPVPAANVPEPSVWALMILGFGSVGALLRRNRRTALAAT
jgi:hypothetical protein